MPNGWIHATIDLIAYGRPYFEIHKYKDEPSKVLGKDHRTIRHEWYQLYGIDWELDDPFPDFLKDMISDIRKGCGGGVAEEQMAYWDHDYIDKSWDEISISQKKYLEGLFAWILLHPDFLIKWAGVDVVTGRIKRFVDGRNVWENCSDLKNEYHRLRCYVEKVIENQ